MEAFDWVQAAACAHDCYAHVVPAQSYAFHRCAAGAAAAYPAA